MKKVDFIKLLTLTAICMSLVFTTACEKEEDGITASIVGSWASSDTEVDMTVNGVSWLSYMVDELGMDQTVAQLAWNEMKSDMEVNGTVEFDAEGIFSSVWENDPAETGSYTLDGNQLTITIVGENAMVFDVITLSETKLVIKMVETETEDFDQDGINETIEMTMQITFTR